MVSWNWIRQVPGAGMKAATVALAPEKMTGKTKKSADLDRSALFFDSLADDLAAQGKSYGAVSIFVVLDAETPGKVYRHITHGA